MATLYTVIIAAKIEAMKSDYAFMNFSTKSAEDALENFKNRYTKLNINIRNKLQTFNGVFINNLEHRNKNGKEVRTPWKNTFHIIKTDVDNYNNEEELKDLIKEYIQKIHDNVSHYEDGKNLVILHSNNIRLENAN